MNKAEYSIAELAAVINADVHGDADQTISGVAPLQSAHAGHLS